MMKRVLLCLLSLQLLFIGAAAAQDETETDMGASWVSLYLRTERDVQTEQTVITNADGQTIHFSNGLVLTDIEGVAEFLHAPPLGETSERSSYYFPLDLPKDI